MIGSVSAKLKALKKRQQRITSHKKGSSPMASALKGGTYRTGAPALKGPAGILPKQVKADTPKNAYHPKSPAFRGY